MNSHFRDNIVNITRDVHTVRRYGLEMDHIILTYVMNYEYFLCKTIKCSTFCAKFVYDAVSFLIDCKISLKHCFNSERISLKSRRYVFCWYCLKFNFKHMTYFLFISLFWNCILFYIKRIYLIILLIILNFSSRFRE